MRLIQVGYCVDCPYYELQYEGDVRGMVKYCKLANNCGWKPLETTSIPDWCPLPPPADWTELLFKQANRRRDELREAQESNAQLTRDLIVQIRRVQELEAELEKNEEDAHKYRDLCR